MLIVIVQLGLITWIYGVPRSSSCLWELQDLQTTKLSNEISFSEFLNVVHVGNEYDFAKFVLYLHADTVNFIYIL